MRKMTKERLCQSALFCLIFLATNYVNKYVLSVLEFKYPTLFQGWQTLVGCLMIKLLIMTRHVQPLLMDTKKEEVATFLPGMALFVGSIYSGSKALANLPIPVFFSLQNLVTVIHYTGQLIFYKKLTSIYCYMMLMLLVISSVGVAKTDPEFHAEGYLWGCIHVMTTGSLGVYTKLVKGRLKLSTHERLYLQYMYSVLVLAPSSYLIGDALEAVKFPYLYFSEFYIGCVMSGIFGVLLNMNIIKLQEMDIGQIDYPKLCGVAKIIASLLSVPFFPFILTGDHVMWLLVNHLAAVACEDSTAVSPGISNVDTEGDAAVNLPKPNTLFKDYLRDGDGENGEYPV